MSDFLRKSIITFAIIVLVLFIALLVSAWILGAFAPVELNVGETGPYFFISHTDKITYANLLPEIQRVQQAFAGDTLVFTGGALIFNDPDISPLSEIQVLAGIFVPDSVSVSSPLILTKINRGLTVTAEIEANTTVAPFKIYPAFAEWLRKNDRDFQTFLPFVEIHQEDGIVHTEMPIQPK